MNGIFSTFSQSQWDPIAPSERQRIYSSMSIIKKSIKFKQFLKPNILFAPTHDMWKKNRNFAARFECKQNNNLITYK